ncbi:oxidoreductase [Gordonibacter sp. An230]|uniref:oxidoreductase n=1 Tax=Gordonibacter sp. An230 TaxID=1965592 RepID=UPI0013A6605D|nr:FAD-dependent oxidoreductase [Gordonibacter sp. An230]
MRKTSLTRRQLLGLGATVAAGSLASASLGGCAPAANTEARKEGSDEPEPSQEGVEYELNPQDGSYTAFTTDYSHLFSSMQVGSRTVKNRIVKSGATSRTVSQGAGFSDDVKNFYGSMAAGGVGLIWMDQFVDFTGKAANGNTPIANDEDAALCRQFTDYVHDQGALIGMQVWGPWSQCSCDGAITAPFENRAAVRKMLSIDEIHAFQADLVHRCEMMQKAGFDGVTLNAGCDHTFSSFLSRFWNTQRDDEYGPQSYENRARILTELIGQIRKACGADFIVEVLYNGVEDNVEYLGKNDGCMTIEEAKEFARLFEKAGADMLQIRYGAYGYHAASFFTDALHAVESGNTGYGTRVDFRRHFEGKVNGQFDGACALLEVAAEIKQAVGIPVGTVGVMDPRLAPDLIDNALAEGKIDYIAMTRPLMCDPELPNKLREGRRDEVAPCNHCLTCLQAVLPHPVTVGCRCNATFGRVKDGGIKTSAKPEPAASPRKVMVVGGGPAGMEAARIAAERGHEVTLYEEDGSLSGLMTFAATVKGPHEKIADFCAYLERQQEVKGVTVTTGTKVDAGLVAEEAPDVVVVAVGGVRPALDAPGAEGSPLVKTIEEAAAGADLGERVVVVGDNHHAIDLAVFLIKRGKAVIILSGRTQEFFDVEHPSWVRYSTKAWMESKGLRVFYESALLAIEEGGVSVATNFGATVSVPCDSVVNCQPLTPNTELFDTIPADIEKHLVGDAAVFSTIAEAVSSGNQAARAI